MSSRRRPGVTWTFAWLLVALLALTVLPASPGTASPATQDRIPERILVRFDADAPASARAAARRDARATERSTIDRLGVHVWHVPGHAAARALAGLQRNPHVEYAETDGRVELDEVATVAPNDPEFARQWGAAKVDADAAWAISRSTSDVTIAILDTGVDPVPDLAGKVLPGRNVMTGTSDVTDDHGHGTASAGVAAATTDNGLVVAGYGWNASVLPVKVMDAGSGTMSGLAAGIVWATDRGADVISMSLSGTSATTTVRDAVRYAADRGVVLVAAAGNQGDQVQRYPAAYPEVVGVAGTDSNDARYSWSNHGSWVDVAAPGVNRSTLRDGGAFNYAGTSSATPVVAGVLALGVPYATGAELRTALQTSAVPLPFVAHGRIDADGMLAALGATGGAPPAPEPDPAPAPEPEPVQEPAPEPVQEPAPAEPTPAIDLRVTGSKTKGSVKAHLRWSGSSAAKVDVHVDGVERLTVPNTGAYTHDPKAKGSPVITYRVCDAGGTSVCSAPVTVSSW